MFGIVASFPYQGKVILIDIHGQVWLQSYDMKKTAIVVEKIGDIELPPEPDRENDPRFANQPTLR